MRYTAYSLGYGACTYLCSEFSLTATEVTATATLRTYTGAAALVSAAVQALCVQETEASSSAYASEKGKQDKCISALQVAVASSTLYHHILRQHAEQLLESHEAAFYVEQGQSTAICSTNKNTRAIIERRPGTHCRVLG